MLGAPKASPAGYAVTMQKMVPRLRQAVEEAVTAKAAGGAPMAS